MVTVWRRVCVVLFLSLFGLSFAQDGPPTGRLEGRVHKADKPVRAAVVVLNELRLTTLTDNKGEFEFDDVPIGSYTIVVTLGSNVLTRPGASVAENFTSKFDIEVDWDLTIVEEITVTAAARAAKIVDAPSAVTSVPKEEIEEQASTGQVPKVLEFTPGAEVTQSGLYDFNFNTRGFNSSLNRRVSTYIDGRDVGVVLLGAQEWAAIAGGLDDVATLDFIRGPSAALYGANASSGVVNIVTKAPKDSLGTLLRVTGGELDSLSLDFRRADRLGNGWFSKVIAGGKDSGDFTITRDPEVNPEPEYSEYCMLIGETDCLPEEKPLFVDQDNEIRFGSLRLDKYLKNDQHLLSFEGGISTVDGPALQTGIGRVQIIDSERRFYRVNYSTPRWNVLGHYAVREGNQANLTADLIRNFELISDDTRYGFEGQANWKFVDGKYRLVVGGAYTREEVDTTNPATGRQTVVYEPITTHREAVFSQFDWQISEKFKAVFAGRVDENTLHSTQFSPKAAFVYSFDPLNSVRFTYNEAFQVANYSEFFLSTRISAFPIGGFVQAICAPFGVDCGIAPGQGANPTFIDILAVGNDDLELEKTQAFEVGYSGLIAKKLFITVDYYNSDNENFITDLVPQVGTILGNTEGCQATDDLGVPLVDPLPEQCPINNDYLRWISTDEAENTFIPGTMLTFAQAIRNAVDNSVGGGELGFRLAQNLDGSTVVIGRTYANVGQVETQGVDFGTQYFITEGLKVQLNFSWFDFEIKDSDPRVNEILLPNTPEYKGSVAVSYRKNKFSASVGARWTDGFRWSAGVFQGDVPEYETVDAAVSYRFTDYLTLGVNVANVLDDRSRQTFGGDILRRRALANVTYRW